MFKNKYSNFLTVILIITIILILAIVSALIIKVYRENKNEKEALNAIQDFENSIQEENSNSSGQNLIVQEPLPNDTNTTPEVSGQSGVRDVKYYNDFVMLGYIEISSINIKYPILEKETVASLEQSVAIRYPDSNPKLNETGNIVIVGHNYRNGKFFSNLKKVSTGDKIKITDGSGRTLTYTIYEKYETTPEDTAYITRNVGDNTEITLVTCTDNSKARIVVKAKA